MIAAITMQNERLTNGTFSGRKEAAFIGSDKSIIGHAKLLPIYSYSTEKYYSNAISEYINDTCNDTKSSMAWDKWTFEFTK